MNDDLLRTLIDIVQSMLESGSEVFRAEDSLRRMCRAYGAKSCDAFILPNSIHVTVQTAEGEMLTQIRVVKQLGQNLDRLDWLNALSRFICDHTPDHDEVVERYHAVLNRKKPSAALYYFAASVSIGLFTVFFGGTWVDGIIAAAITAVVVPFQFFLMKYEDNSFVLNFVIAALIGIFAIGVSRLGIGEHPGIVIVGCVMWLISSIGLTNGVRDLLRSDVLSGSLRIINSLMGATAIAAGIAVTLFLMHHEMMPHSGFTTNFWVQIVTSTISCGLFAICFYMSKVQMIYSGLGSAVTWTVWVLTNNETGSLFISTTVAAMFVAAFAEVMARVNRAPATVFLTTGIFPLVPGGALYRTMYGVVTEDSSLALQNAVSVLNTVIGIALGFIVMGIIVRYLRISTAKYRKVRRSTARAIEARRIRRERRERDLNHMRDQERQRVRKLAEAKAKEEASGAVRSGEIDGQMTPEELDRLRDPEQPLVDDEEDDIWLRL